MIAPKYNKPDLDYAAIEAAISRGVNDAVLTHARLGYAVPEWRDHKVVWIQPEEILATVENPGSLPESKSTEIK